MSKLITRKIRSRTKIHAGSLITEVSLRVDVPFEMPVTISVGSATAPAWILGPQASWIMGPQENLPQQANCYTRVVAWPVPSDYRVLITLQHCDRGGSGSGAVHIHGRNPQNLPWAMVIPIGPSKARAKRENVRDRVLVVFNASEASPEGAWFCRHVRRSQYDLTRGETSYHCDRPISGPHATLDEAVASLRATGWVTTGTRSARRMEKRDE